MPQAAIPVAAAVAGGVASAGAAKLFSGSGPKIPDPTATIPRGFTTPGLSITPSTVGGRTIRLPGGRTRTLGGSRGIEVTRTNDFLEQLGLVNREEADRLAGLIEQVRPGVGALTDARLTGLNNVRRRTIGDIRENLARRRVLGSSFAQDALTRANREFAEQEAEIRASSFLQELQLTQQLAQQRADTLRSTVLTGLEQSNFEAQLAANFANRTQAVMGQVGQFQAQLAAQAQAGMGAFFQPIVSGIGDAVSTGITNAFSSSSPTPLVGTISPQTGFT